MGTYKGIDLSAGNSKCDFAKMKKAGVEFVIIRLGWGGDYPTQDDKMWKEYVDGCEKNGIPYGLYLYSYALVPEQVNNEIVHALRIAKQCNPTLGIWYDMEDADQYKKKHGINVYKSRDLLTSFCVQFCTAMIKAGYKTGIYASLDYFKNVLTSKAQEYDTWVAAWCNTKPTSVKNMIMWQYMGSESKKKYDGSGGSGNDMDYWYGELPGATPKPTPKEEGYKGTMLSCTVPYWKKGDTQNEIKNLQSFLNWYGNYSLKVDGVFGDKTHNAAVDFQLETKLIKTRTDGSAGLVGPKTIEAMKNYKK